MFTCDYEYHSATVDFKCQELVHNRDVTRCIFHDINYLKGANYEKNKEEVANRFKIKLSKYLSNNIPFKFFGYYLPEISFRVINSRIRYTLMTPHFMEQQILAMPNFLSTQTLVELRSPVKHGFLM
jgi:hypothetical protein